jgi:AcrR family transcriptional regulator
MASSSSPATASTRRYTSARRARQAAQTRADVLLAAVRLFGQNGWAGTTLAAIAAEAGVAVETIYTGFSSKKALLRAAMDVAIVGDAEPVPWLEREEIRRLRQLPLEERPAAGMPLVSQMYSDRVTGVWSAMLEAAASDEEVAAWCAEIEKGRREIVREFCEIIFQRPVREQVLDALWILSSPDAYTKLTTQRGWSRSTWEDTMTEVIRRLIA